MQKIIDAIAPRLTEPSTWIGVITLVGNLTGWGFLTPEMAAALSTALSGIAGVGLVLVREGRQ